VKFLAVVDHDQTEPLAHVQVDYTGKIPVEGNPPRPGLLICECPGLEKADRKSLLAWLARGGGKRVGHGKALPDAPAAALDAIPASCWRRAGFGEVIELPNYEQLLYLAVYAAPLGEITACLSERIPPVLARIDAALALGDGEQIEKLGKAQGETKKVSLIAWSLSARTERHIAEVAQRVDSDALASLRKRREFDVAVWVSAAAAMKADPGRVTALTELVRLIPEGPGAAEHMGAILDAIREKKALFDATRFAFTFWAAVAPLLDLPATMHDGEVDLSDAVEGVAAAGWDVYNARRVGRIKLGRKVLVLSASGGRALTYVRGTRALLEKVIAAGGRLRHHGVTLTYPAKQRPLTPLLVEVTRIDTLAYVDPPAALALLAERAPPADHPLYALAVRAHTDPASARAFADILIEFATGIDADVARKLARGKRL
jgi:hypothetical protein